MDSTTASKIKFIGDFRGLIGQKGQKGHLFGPVFFPGRALNFACKTRAWLNRKQVMFGISNSICLQSSRDMGVHLFIYRTKRVVFLIPIGTLKQTTD